jgi:hypothetical protein
MIRFAAVQTASREGNVHKKNWARRRKKELIILTKSENYINIGVQG